jgi:hypothetical protein
LDINEDSKVRGILRGIKDMREKAGMVEAESR